MPPSPFVVEWIARLAASGEAPRRALDVAMGRGRHAVLLARAGFRTFGVDKRLDAVRDAIANTAADGHRLYGWCADLTQHPLPAGRFDLVLVTRYLERDLFPTLAASLVPGGTLVYETFTVGQRAFGCGPRSPEHLLDFGELRRLCDGLEIQFDEEVSGPEALARIVARRRTHRSPG